MNSKKIKNDLKASIANAMKSSSKPKEVLKSLRRQHPDVKSKDFALAAFSVMIEVSDSNVDLARTLQEFGLNEHQPSDD